MDFGEAQNLLEAWSQQAAEAFQKVPGSAVLIRYVRSSYQNDPIRSALELVLVVFFIRYLLSPSYSTQKQNYVKLRDEVGISRFPVCAVRIVMSVARPAGSLEVVLTINRKSTSWSMTGCPNLLLLRGPRSSRRKPRSCP